MYYRMIRAGTPWSTIPGSWRSTNTDGPWPSCGDSTGPGAPFLAYARKSYLTDPSLRPRWRRMVAWWFTDQVKRFLLSCVEGTYATGNGADRTGGGSTVSPGNTNGRRSGCNASERHPMRRAPIRILHIDLAQELADISGDPGFTETLDLLLVAAISWGGWNCRERPLD